MPRRKKVGMRDFEAKTFQARGKQASLEHELCGEVCMHDQVPQTARSDTAHVAVLVNIEIKDFPEIVINC